MRRATAPLVLVLLVLSSCGGDDDTVGTGSDDSSTSSSSSTSTPSSTSTTAGTDATPPPTEPAGDPAPTTASDAIRIVTCCAFSPYGTDFAAVPTVVGTDGTAFTGGAQTLQYPGPAISPVTTGKLSAKQVDALLTAAKDAGLTTKRDYGQPGITDVGTTKITVTIDGKAHTAEIYALGYEGEAGGISADQKAARAKASAFVTKVSDAVSAAATTSFQPTGYQVLAIPSQPLSDYSDPKPNQLDWPIASKPLAEGPCRDITGADAATLKAALAKATQITIWNSGGKGWQVVTRAVLPGDAPCK